MSYSIIQGAHLSHFTQLFFLLPNPQLLQMLAGVLLFAIHLLHFAQLSFLFPKEQLLHKIAGVLLFAIHLSHLVQLSFLFPKEQLLHKYAIYLGISLFCKNNKSIKTYYLLLVILIKI